MRSTRPDVALADGKIERVTSSIVVGLTAVLLYLLARRSLRVPGSLLVALIFAFCTAAWSTAHAGTLAASARRC